jgi:DNA polymerase I
MVTVFDIETNYPDHMRTLEGLDTFFVAAVSQNGETRPVYNIHELVDILNSSSMIVGHNIINFDIPAIEKLSGQKITAKVRDTLVMSRLECPDMLDSDLRRKGMPKQYAGRHSLAAWGYRLGSNKIEFKDFSELSDEMVEYCVQDTELTAMLWTHLKALPEYIESVVETEHQFAKCIQKMCAAGVCFDVEEAEKLSCLLHAEVQQLIFKLQEQFPPTVQLMKTPEYYLGSDGKHYSRKKDAPSGVGLQDGPLRKKYIPFNPASRQQIADRLSKVYGWKPNKFTDKGTPIVDESVLETLNYPPVADLLRFFVLNKRLGQLSEGQKAWTKLVRSDGFIYPDVNPCGAVTSRCTHSNPNLAQVPAEKEYRRLFKARPGRKFVGCDAKGLELRCLAHYTFPYDKGYYVDLVTDPGKNIHEENMKALGLEDKPLKITKAATYCWLYGGGDKKLGATVDHAAPPAVQIQDGAMIRAKFLNAIPALGQLSASVGRNTGTLQGVDGRILKIRHQHAALNTLLQSAGAIAMKYATIFAIERILERNLDAIMVLHVHDEFQFDVAAEHAEEVADILEQSIARAGRALKFNCPLAGESAVGETWADTH